jgi:TRAP-type mannitol/chloroaromatic compound transport system permease small subunit
MSKGIDRFSTWVGEAFSYLLIPLTLFVVYEVITRSFGSPTVWTFEMSNMTYGAHFMLVAAYGLLMKSHVAIDLVSSKYSKKTNAVFSLICYVTMYLPFVAVWTYYGIDTAYSSWGQLENSWSTWGPPLYPIKTVIPVTAIMLLLQGMSEMIKDINALVEAKGVSK